MDMKGLRDADDSLEMMVFDDSLSFLDDLEASSDSMASLLDDDTQFGQELLFSDRRTTDKRQADATVSAGGVDEAIRPKIPALVEKSADAKARSTTNTRQKKELTYLRTEAARLEAQLAQLKLAQETPCQLREPSTSTWEMIAKRQSEQKQMAVIENDKLRELLEAQLKVSKRLEELLNKRVLRETVLHLRRSSLLGQRPIIPETNVESIFEEIRARIHLQFDHVDTVMEACGLSVVCTELDEAQWTTRRSDHNAIELRMVKALPFPVELVAAAVWQCTSATHIDLQDGYVEASQICETTCNLNLVVRVQQRRIECVMAVNGVAARRADADRSLFVFEAVGRTQGRATGSVPIECREHGYASIQKNPSPNSASSTIVRIYKRLVVESTDLEGHETVDDRSVGSFVDLLLGSYGQNAKTLLQLVENSLLEESLKRAPAST